jgi:hypothetical protein
MIGEASVLCEFRLETNVQLSTAVTSTTGNIRLRIHPLSPNINLLVAFARQTIL